MVKMENDEVEVVAEVAKRGTKHNKSTKIKLENLEPEPIERESEVGNNVKMEQDDE